MLSLLFVGIEKIIKPFSEKCKLQYLSKAFKYYIKKSAYISSSYIRCWLLFSEIKSFFCVCDASFRISIRIGKKTKKQNSSWHSNHFFFAFAENRYIPVSFELLCASNKILFNFHLPNWEKKIWRNNYNNQTTLEMNFALIIKLWMNHFFIIFFCFYCFVVAFFVTFVAENWFHALCFVVASFSWKECAI